MEQYEPGVFIYNATTADFAFSGVLFRTIPSGSDEPLSARFSQGGGRWSWPNTHFVLHTFSAFQTAQVAFSNNALTLGIDLGNVNPEFQKDLLVLRLNVNHLADVATAGGLQNFGLPVDYPIGFQSEEAWSTTRPIGHRIYATTASGLVTRSASLSEWTGPMPSWAEVILFPDRSEEPQLIERVPFKDWFYR